MQSICSAAAAMILVVANPTPCAPSGGGVEPALGAAPQQQLASHVGFGLPRLPSLPRLPQVPQAPRPKWP
jgi:hypothetical protein